MTYPFQPDSAEKLLENRRKALGRGLCYSEKILFLHELSNGVSETLRRGRDGIRLRPDRVALQDATAQMAMLQFMQTGRERVRVPATIHCDHLLRAAEGAEPDLAEALSANREVYNFLSSAAARYGLGFWGPGSGIIHQVVLENYALPGGLMIGTDSHTPNAGGLGMLAVGVGGADAAEVMAGLHWETVAPRIVGVELSGSLRGWSSAKDVILALLQRLSVKGGTGKILEYFGDGARSLSATQKATITNMGAELGATCSVFVVDQTMLRYLENVGRHRDAQWVRAAGSILTRDPFCEDHPEEVYDEILHVDLDNVLPAHAGPFSPDRVTPVRDFRKTLTAEGWPRKVSAVLLGSCTNSSYSDLSDAAQVLDQAAAHGLKPRVPFLLSPGSRQVTETIRRDGILQRLLDAGAVVLTASCGPCIGQWDRKDVPENEPNTLFTTFNRNFRGRNDANPETRAFLTSPALAAALAVSGDAGFNPETDPLTGADQQPFLLRPPQSPQLPEQGMVLDKTGFIPPQENPEAEVQIEPDSERLAALAPFSPWAGTDFVDLPVLVKTQGKTTTDHISPGGEWLRYRGHLSRISRNLLSGATNAFTREVGKGTHILTGEKDVPLSSLAADYGRELGGFVIVGDENYGEGSSREHAAMSPRFLGAKAVIARSFARIHEANLKKQGILPLIFQDPEDYDRIREGDRMSLLHLGQLHPGTPVSAVLSHADGTTEQLTLEHTLTDEQIRWFRAGAALNTLRGEQAS